MPERIEDYALIGDCQTAALVSRWGSIDWLCLPRFDSGACFAALLGDADNGRWLLCPDEPVRSVERSYRGDTLILDTRFRTDGGEVVVTDFMPPRTKAPDLVRIVTAVHGSVPMRMELTIRFDYGSVIPWVRRHGDELRAVAGPDALVLRTPVALRGQDMHTVARFGMADGKSVPFMLTWYPSNEAVPPPRDTGRMLDDTMQFWSEWAGRAQYDEGGWRGAVLRSLIVLKAMTYSPTGALVAAPTTSLPEHIGGIRNWDYRFSWLRDATMSLLALSGAGYTDEARSWQRWLLRAAAGDPRQIQIMYGLEGQRRLPELELPWLSGYEGSRPVRTGNAAHRQLQLDVFGEILDATWSAAKAGTPPDDSGWRVLLVLLDRLKKAWREPDQGIWEVRGRPRHFTHSKVMAWVAFDRAIKLANTQGLDAPLHEWAETRNAIFADVCANAWNERLRSFAQFYGADTLDASLLLIPLVGFLPPEDGRVRSTASAIMERLMDHGLLRRYEPKPEIEGVTGDEGVFLACSFWLADCLELLGRHDEAVELFERVLTLRNDVGLLSEEYDPVAHRLLGNFPQAFSHVYLVSSARGLSSLEAPFEPRRR